MNGFAQHVRQLAALLALAACLAGSAASVARAEAGDPEALLARAEQVRTSDRTRFNDILAQLHRDEAQLTPAQHWHLRYLDTSQLIFKGDDAGAVPILRDIIDHGSDPSIKARATASLLQIKYLAHQYQEAYALAYDLMSRLPRIDDPIARRSALSKVVQMLNSGGQHDLALKYARQIKASFPSGKGQCEGKLSVTQTKMLQGKLSSDDPEIQDTVDTCLAVDEVVSANALRLDLASMYVDEGHPGKAIELLNKIEPSIRKAEYHFHVAALHCNLALAYSKLGDDDNARRYALQTLADNDPDTVNWTVQNADKILFEVAKRSGHPDAALSYYEKYVAMKQNATDDAKARALAYQMVRQDVVANNLKLDALDKQNKILQLKQSLAANAAETSRLYIVILVIALALIALWLYRIKHSQLRFRQLARHDGLTGIFNRQHFFDQSERIMKRLQRSGGEACLVLLDLDHFKHVNDQHGHPAGDDVLKRSVAICLQELRESDIFGRLGGEEFGILMPGCDCESGVDASNRIRRKLAATPIELDNGTLVNVTASFGLVCSERSGFELTRLTTLADGALYRAKNAGRNQLVVGDADTEAATAPGTPMPEPRQAAR